MSRSPEILRAAAAALEEGTDPFSSGFLDKHQVTLDECFEMAEGLALGAQIVAWVKEHPRDAAAFARNGAAGMAMDAVTRALASKIGKEFGND